MEVLFLNVLQEQVIGTLSMLLKFSPAIGAVAMIFDSEKIFGYVNWLFVILTACVLFLVAMWIGVYA